MKKKNLKFIVGGAIVAVAIGFLAYGGVQKAALYYLTVSELKERGPSETSGEMVRVNGIVLDESFQYRLPCSLHLLVRQIQKIDLLRVCMPQ